MCDEVYELKPKHGVEETKEEDKKSKKKKGKKED